MTMADSKFRHKARFISAEFLVIVLGVLVALGVDEFRADRADDALEDEYGLRLIADLQADSAYFAWFGNVLNIKAEVLQSLLNEPAEFREVDDPVRKMSGLVYSTFVGLPHLSGATFQELQSTGRLGLLDDREIRSALGSHYAQYSRISEIMDERFGPYREAVFAALPGQMQFEARLDSTQVDPVALADGLGRLTEVPGIEEAVNAELAYTASMLFFLGEADHRTADLLHRLRQAY